MHFTFTPILASGKPAITNVSSNFKVVMKIAFSFMLTMLFLNYNATAQTGTGTVKGTVKTADGKAAEFVNIFLTNTKFGATTGQSGHFTIKNIPAGPYTIVASFIGLQSQTKEITVSAGETTTVGFVLTEGAKDLAGGVR